MKNNELYFDVLDFPGGTVVKNLPGNAADRGLILGPQLFWHQGLVSWKTFFHRWEEGMVLASPTFHHSPPVMWPSSYQATDWSMALALGTPAIKGIRYHLWLQGIPNLMESSNTWNENFSTKRELLRGKQLTHQGCVLVYFFLMFPLCYHLLRTTTLLILSNSRICQNHRVFLLTFGCNDVLQWSLVELLMNALSSHWEAAWYLLPQPQKLPGGITSSSQGEKR